jgi:hypothetical protein
MWIAIGTPPFTSIETFDAVCARFGGEPAGLLGRYAGTVGDELRIVMVWASKDAADSFFVDTLGPALAAVLGPEPSGRPTIVGFEAQRTYERELVG